MTGRDIRSLALSHTDAYVWSRIDGSMSEDEIVLVSGLDADLVRNSLARLAQLGAIRFEGAPRNAVSHVAPRAPGPSASGTRLTARASERVPFEPQPRPSTLYPKQAASTIPSPRRSTRPPPGSDQLNRYLEAARESAAGGNPAAAANFYRLAMHLAPNDPSIKAALDECASASTEARTANQRVESLLRDGDALAHEQRWEAALGRYERAVEQAPKSSEALYKAGGTLYKLGERRREAEDYVQRSLAADPKRLEAWLLLARIQLELGATKAARAAAEEAQKLAPDDPRVLRVIAKLERV
jgi:tetratricopeptide (TPR) repeat protein